MKIVANAFGERAVLKLMYAALIRASESWRGIQVKPFETKQLEAVYAYIRIRAFQERTSQDLEEILEQLHEGADGRFEGLVLDLRDNPGVGSLARTRLRGEDPGSAGKVQGNRLNL